MPHSTVNTRDESGRRVCPYCGRTLYRTAGGRWPVACTAHRDLPRLEPLDDRYTLAEHEAEDVTGSGSRGDGVSSSASLDMGLPPGARRLDVRATRAAFAAGTLGTVGDNASSVNEQRRVESGDADGYDPHDVKHDAEMVRQARLRRWQAIR